MLFKKITEGCAIQTFNDVGEFLCQEFVAGDSVAYVTKDGDPINSADMPLGGNEYHPFFGTSHLIDLREQLQEDMMCILDGLDDELVNRVCDSIVERVNEAIRQST